MAFGEKKPSALEYVFDGGGLAITGTPIGKLIIPQNFSNSIVSAGLVTDLIPTSLIVEIRKCTRDAYPAGLVSITGSAHLDLAGDYTMLDSVLDGWDTEVDPDNVYEFDVLVTDTVTNILVFLNFEK